MTSSRDNTARIWDAATGKQLIALRGHKSNRFTFSPDGTRIVATSNTTIVRPWNSVPYAQRYRQKHAYKKAELRATRLLDIVTATAPRRDGAPDLLAVAKSIRTDPGIDDTVRHVAINLLMRRADQIRSKANDVVEEVKNHFVFAADIQAAVKAAPSLEPPVHAAANHMAHLIEDSPDELFRRAGRIIDDDKRSPADYEEAQKAAASAFDSKPTNLNFAKRLVKAWTRLHQPDKAVEVWREHVEKLRDTPPDDWRWTTALIEYGKALMKNDRAEEAEPLLRECLSFLINKGRNGGWNELINKTRLPLAECLTKQARFTEAEVILIEMADAILKDDTVYKDAKTKAIQRVVDFYEAWHAAEPDADLDSTDGTPLPQKAAEWRAKLPATTSQPVTSQPTTTQLASQPTSQPT